MTNQKNQAPDIFYKELEIQKRRRTKAVSLGSPEEILALISSRMTLEYPEIEFDTLCLPFREELTVSDYCQIEKRIKVFVPGVVFIIMTCPKQEIWLNTNINRYNGVLFMAIRRVFEWLAGTRKE